MAKLNLEDLKHHAEEIAGSRGISYEEALELLVNGIEAELINQVNDAKQWDAYFWKVESFKEANAEPKGEVQGLWKQLFKNGRGLE